MHKLKGFHYAAALYINMRYYTISISPASQYMTTIVTKFGKFIYNCLPMGMCASGDIFQAKLDTLLGVIWGFKTYIDGILVLINDSFEKNIDHLRIISLRLRVESLKAIAPKCSFWLKYIPYLGYVITREFIKPNPKKVQGIMDFGQTSITIETRALIGMVQYYRYIWPRRSHILAPLTESVSGPKGGNILWNDALESSFKELKCMVSAETLLSYPDWKLPFTVHTDTSDK